LSILSQKITPICILEILVALTVTTMVAPKRQRWGSRCNLTHITATFAVVLCFATLLKLGTFSKCDHDVNIMKVDNNPNQLNGQKRTPSLSSRQSYGFFDDILDDSWKIMQERARASSSYSNRENPEEFFKYPMHWYMSNLQVCERLIVRATH
jgi:hypothetical protein